MSNFNDEYKTSWKTKSSQEKKSWGYEIRAGSLTSVCAKVLCMDSGKSTSLKYYQHKNEVLFLRKGKVVVTHGHEYTLKDEKLYPYETTTLLPGDGMCIQSGCPYKMYAEEYSEIIELGDSTSGAVKIDLENIGGE